MSSVSHSPSIVGVDREGRRPPEADGSQLLRTHLETVRIHEWRLPRRAWRGLSVTCSRGPLGRATRERLIRRPPSFVKLTAAECAGGPGCLGNYRCTEARSQQELETSYDRKRRPFPSARHTLRPPQYPCINKP